MLPSNVYLHHALSVIKKGKSAKESNYLQSNGGGKRCQIATLHEENVYCVEFRAQRCLYINTALFMLLLFDPINHSWLPDPRITVRCCESTCPGVSVTGTDLKKITVICETNHFTYSQHFIMSALSYISNDNGSIYNYVYIN